jgi:hypothetical protein
MGDPFGLVGNVMGDSRNLSIQVIGAMGHQITQKEPVLQTRHKPHLPRGK